MIWWDGNIVWCNNVVIRWDECLVWWDDKMIWWNEYFFLRFDVIVIVEDLVIVDWEIWVDSIVDICINFYKLIKYVRNGWMRDVFEIWKKEKFVFIVIRNFLGFFRKLFFLIIEYCEYENCWNCIF